MEMSFYEYELILINDGSTDSSGYLCDEFATKDQRIKVIHKQNGGISSARNAGLTYAQGKYIVFCDSDDYYDSEMMSEILRTLPAKSNEHTLYAFNFRNVWPGYVEEAGIYPANELCFENQEEIVEYFSSRISHKAMGYAVWDKIYCKSVIDKYQIRMIERDTMGHKDDWAEDLIFNLSYGQHIRYIKVLESPAYMLRKYGMPDEQHELNLVNRTEHMMDFFSRLVDSYSISCNQEVVQDFWKIVIWHMKRYFDLDCSHFGTDSLQCLRKNYMESKHWHLLSSYICVALTNWKEYGHRWETKHSKEYKYFLQYLLNGNELMFKIKNKMLYSFN